MSWENYGSIWHIDHKIPCSSWNFESDFEMNCCWNYRNLQPMLASENQSKHDNFKEEDKNEYIEKYPGLKIYFYDINISWDSSCSSKL